MKTLLIDDTRMLQSATRIDKTAAGGIRSLAQDYHWDVLFIDHDLGINEDGSIAMTGYDVLTWLEENIQEHPEYLPGRIQIISGNPVGRMRMQQVLSKLYPVEREVLAAQEESLYQTAETLPVNVLPTISNPQDSLTGLEIVKADWEE